MQSTVSPAVAGLVMVNVFQTATFIPFVMQLKSAFLAFINSLDRCFEYTDLDQEAPAVIESKKPSKNWPEKGNIRFNGVSFKYRPELPLVLKNINLKISEFFSLTEDL